jgi:lipoprotein-releasing system permease protein
MLKFLRYFISYLIKTRSRQKIIFLAFFGLFISSFALLFLQGVMGGLQFNMMARSQGIHGSGLVRFRVPIEQKDILRLVKDLKAQGKKVFQEYEIELLGKSEGFLAPVILRGVELSQGMPVFLKEADFEGVVLGSDLSAKLRVNLTSKISFYSPSHTNELFGDVPRMVADHVSDFLHTNQIEIDGVTAWSRIGLVQNLVGDQSVNVLRFFDPTFSKEEIEQTVQSYFPRDKWQALSWEDQFPELLWAFQLENVVIISLFMSIGFLISLTIVSGFLIFFNKVKIDLVSFWVMGLSKKKIEFLMMVLVQSTSFLVTLFGVLCSYFVLQALKYYSPALLPDVFVERSLPVSLDWKDFVMALFAPFFISSLFAVYSLKQFFRENKSFLLVMRKISA